MCCSGDLHRIKQVLFNVLPDHETFQFPLIEKATKQTEAKQINGVFPSVLQREWNGFVSDERLMMDWSTKRALSVRV